MNKYDHDLTLAECRADIYRINYRIRRAKVAGDREALVQIYAMLRKTYVRADRAREWVKKENKC